MVQTIHPVDADVVTHLPSYTGRMLRQVGSVAFAGATAARPFGAISGVRPGTSTTTVTATATTWTVNPHAGLLDFEVAMESGPTPYAIDAAVTGAMRAADGFARVDLIWVRQDIPVEDSSSAAAPVPGYTYGTVASTPPATPARCLVIAQVNVPASGGGSPSVTWVAPYAVSAGAPAISWTTSGDIYVTVAGGTCHGPITVPAVSYATRVFIEVEGAAGNNGSSASDVAVSLVGSITPTQRASHPVTAASLKWASVACSGYVDVPANTSATVTVVGALTVASWFTVGMTLTRVAN